MTNRLAFGISGMLMILFMSTTVRAQVGHLPDRSPFQDLEQRQELSVLVGNFHGHRDAADVAPSGGLLVGLQYQWRAAGPAYLIGDFARISSDRRRLNPFLVGAARDLGTENQPLYTGSAGLGIGLTGGKTWHHLVPEITGGVGFISDFSSKPDTGGFKFGTRFALNWGAGIRWIPRNGAWQIRGDLTNRLYSISYPEQFYIAPSGGTAVVDASQSKSFWTNNPAFTIGVSRLF